jgi:predicted secreted protein
MTVFLLQVAGRVASITRNTTTMEAQYVITVTDTSLLGAAVRGAARLATVGRHRTCHICMTAMAPVPAAAMTTVAAAARPTTGSQQWGQSRTRARQRHRPFRKDLKPHMFCDE